jgi:hypothetical protein
VPDYERLQATLDDIAGVVEWAVGWLEYLEENEVRGIGTSDRAILKAESERLRVVADGLLPGRVRDPLSGRRWYLAPDEAFPREQLLLRALDVADEETGRAGREVTEGRLEDEREEQERKDRRQREDNERRERHEQEHAEVAAYLRKHGPSTATEIAEGTDLSVFAAEQAAKAVAKRGKDQRFAIS